MRWGKTKLKELCSVITKGTTPSNIGADFVEVGVNYIRSEMLTSSKYIASNGMLYIDISTHEKLKRSQLQKGDILFSMAGVYLGKTSILREKDVPANTNQAVALIRVDESKCNREYVYYYLNLSETVKKVNTVSGQSAQPNINLRLIGNIEVELPSIEKQNTIVFILSAYDDLIENNQKQIKLLEEAAQRLYKEWFVDLRFPGYENTPIIDGVPDGWRKGTLGDVAPFKRGKTITKDRTSVGEIPVVAGGLEPAYYHNQSNTSSPVITVSGSGANAGFTKMYYEKIWASDCSFVDKQNTSHLYFTFCVLKNKKSVIDILQKGAAQPHVYAKDINTLEIAIPEIEILARFENTVSPYFEKVKVLLEQIELSKQARDRLLPKLMSGELEV